jgi:hypothetical protein
MRTPLTLTEVTHSSTEGKEEVVLHRTLPLMVVLRTKARLRGGMGVDIEAFRVTLGRGGLFTPMASPETIILREWPNLS